MRCDETAKSARFLDPSTEHDLGSLMTQVEAYHALVGYGEREGNPTLGLGQFWTSLRLDSSPNDINGPLTGLAQIHFIP